MQRVLISFSIYLLLLSCGGNNTAMTHQAIPPIKWKISGSLPNDSAGQPSTGLAGPVAGISCDHLILGGGANFPAGPPWEGGSKQYHQQVFIYKLPPGQDSVLQLSATSALPYEVAYSANCTTEKGIVMAGGENRQGPLKKVLLLNWDTVEQKLVTTRLPDLPEPATAGMLAASHGQLYFAGGNHATATSRLVLRLDLDHPDSGWQAVASLPKPTANGMLFAVPGRDQLYLAGGRKINKDAVSDFYADVYQLDIRSGRWTKKAALPYPLSAQTGITLNADTLLLFSGDRGETFHETEKLLLQIAAEKDEQRKKVLIRQKNRIQQTHPGFSKEVLAYDLARDRWTVIGTMPFPGQVTTTAIPRKRTVIIPCGEIRAAVRSARIVTGNFK